ncbi:hypothetical protein [Helicobacter cappadocius]|uniref:Uncharacterized protein n=1 Tax=Helicobacter cappadocius TaxID=3063998 RepID=A0AA90PK43_9HELI|nr:MULTISPECIES: hypothetical protein [unclassified Helicobacter]MDO7253843.1 hypothetical protein [Helicobacter sp. faydin-H75]MDP2539732.1 hypothetical protein [Helicobacter sp. faydin-H76]
MLECYFYTLEAKNAQDYLYENIQILKSYYKQVKVQSIQKKYPIFRKRYIIEHSVYSGLSENEKQKLNGQLVLTNFILKNFIKYSNFGGIGVGGILAEQYDDKKAKTFYLSFDGRYLTDLEFLGLGSELYAYCVLPNFNHCVLLGIGEDWK